MASETNDGKDGGLLKGKRHEDKNGNSLGGIKAIVTDTNQMVELEGGEVIINREASKKHWKELSRINQSAGGGVPILPPDNAVSDTEEYKKGGRTIEFNPNLLPNKWVYSYAKKIKEKYPKVWALGGNEYGNEAFKNLERAYERGNWTENEEWMYVKWQSFNARHKKDFRIAGVIANLKWLNVVEKGWDYMKNLIEEEIEKRYQKGWKHKMKTGGGVEGETIKIGILIKDKEDIEEFFKEYNFVYSDKATIKKPKEVFGSMTNIIQYSFPKEKKERIIYEFNQTDITWFLLGSGTKEGMKTGGGVKFAGGGKLPDLTQVQSDANSFKPDGNRPDDKPTLDVNNNTIEFAFRNLGNWVNDEEDGQDDYEDNDQRVWAVGQFTKYKRLFLTWAKKYDWYKYAILDISTGEKDWAYFYITIEKAEVKKDSGKTTPPPSKTTPPPKKKAKKVRKPPMFMVGDYFTTKSTGDTLFLIYSTKDIKVHWNDVLKPSTKGNYALSKFFSMIRKGEVEIVKGVPKEQKVEFKTGDIFRTKGTGDEEWEILKVSDTEVEYKGLQSNQKMKLSRIQFESNFTDAMDWDLRWYRVENKKVEFKVGDWFYEVGFEDEPFVVSFISETTIGFGDFEGDNNPPKAKYKISEALRKIKDGLWKATTKPKTLEFEKDDLVIYKHRKELGQVQKVTKTNGVTTYEIVLTDGTKYYDTTDFGWKIADDSDLKERFFNRVLVSARLGNYEIVDVAQHLPKKYFLSSSGGMDFNFSGNDLFDLLSGLDVHEYYLKKDDNKTEEKPKETSDFEFVQKTPTGVKSKLNYLQQILVRSKPFKDWFGDWETASKNYIANGKKDFDKDFENVSKVMDMETLEPRVVYHGTPRPEEFFVFETRATGLNRPYSYFAHNIEYSQNFHTENSKVLYHCFLNVRTPFRALGKGYEQRRENADYWEDKIIGTIAWDKYAEISKTNKGAISIKKVMSAMGNYLQALAGNDAPFWRIMSFDIIGLFKAFLEHYQYDGMFYSEEWTKGYDEKNPAEFTKAVCVFNPQQIKLADGRNLAFDGNNPDIRYKKGGEVEPPNDHINRKAKLGNLLFGKKYADGGNLEQQHLQDNRLVETSPPKKQNESTTFVEDLINKMKNN